MHLELLNFFKEKKFYFYIFLLLNILTFVLELASLASVPIFISAMITPDYLIDEISNNKFLNIQIIDNRELFVLSSYLVLATFFLKNVFLIILTYFQDKYLKNLNKEISKRLFNFYIKGPFHLHLESNPATLARNISHEIQGATTYLYQIFMLTRDIFTLVVIFALLAFVNFKITFVIVLFLIFALFFYLNKTKPAIKKLANFNQETRKIINKIIFETFGAIKDIKILKKEISVSDYYYSKISKYEENYFKFKLISKLPKFILELFAITVLVMVGLVFASSIGNLEQVLPTLSVVAISLLRLIPAFNSLNANYNYLRLYNVSINLIINELKKTEKEYVPTTTQRRIIQKNNKNFIEINDLTFGYNLKQNIFENLNLKIFEGEKICIVGPTGSGKTTLFHLMLGLLNPNKGFIAHKGKSIIDNLDNWYNKIGYISQNIYILDDSVKKNITLNYNNEIINEKLLNESVSISNLKDKIKDSPFALETKVGMDGLKLSGGEKQRIAIARAIYKNPQIFLMDEFTSAIDQETEEKIFNNLITKFSKQTLIMIAHRKSIIEKCDIVWEIKNKNIIKIK